MSDLRSSVTAILEKLESVDYKGVADKMIATLDSADKFLNDPQIRHILQQLDAASAGINTTVRSLNESLTKEKIQTLMRNSETAMESVSSLSRMIEAELKTAEIGKTAEEARSAMNAFRKSNHAVMNTMNELNEAISAVIELIQYIDSDPASLIRGKAAAEKQK